MTKPIERNVARILEDIEAQRAALADAQREIGEFQLRRREMLTTGSVDQVQEIDTSFGRATQKSAYCRRQDQCVGGRTRRRPRGQA